MKRAERRARRTVGPICFAGAVLALVLAADIRTPAAPVARAQPPETLVMIIAASTRITDLPSNLLRAAFGGLRAEYRGVRLIPFNAPPNTWIRKRSDRALLGLEQAEVGRFWVNERVRDGRMPPRTVPSKELRPSAEAARNMRLAVTTWLPQACGRGEWGERISG